MNVAAFPTPAGRREPSPALKRLAALASLDVAAHAALVAAFERRRLLTRRRELAKEGAPVGEAKLILDGWAARVRDLEDGRRQILGFLLPGDLIGRCGQSRPLSVSTVVALTDLVVCPAPSDPLPPPLAEAFAVSQALQKAYLLANVTRLGRMTAEERLLDLFLELHERLDLCGLAPADGFALPVTQEGLGDAVGLTPVHVNRVLQHLRRRGDITLKGGWLTLSDPQTLARAVGRPEIRVTEGALNA